MRIPTFLRRPTNSIPLSYERFLYDRSNVRIPDSIPDPANQKLTVKSIFGNLSTHSVVKTNETNLVPFNSLNLKDQKDVKFDLNHLNSKYSKNSTCLNSSDQAIPDRDQLKSSNSFENSIKNDPSSGKPPEEMIDDLSKSNDSDTYENLVKSNTSGSDSQLSPFNFLSKVGQNNLNVESNENPEDVKETDSNDLVKDVHLPGSDIFEGRYSHLSEYRIETVDSIVSKGVDVPERINCLIKERGLRGLTKESLEILSEMKRLRIPVTTETYNNCLISCMKTKNAKLARYLYLCLRADILTPDLRTYTLMIKTHVNSGDIASAFALYRKMEKEGTKADLVVFSVLIDCLVENRQSENAWRLFNYMRTWRLIEPDEVLFTIMIKSCTYSREPEKALNLYQEMLTLNKFPTIHTYTELINCLSNRKDYFTQCFQFYNQIKSQEYRINDKIITYLLRSCCSAGNVRKARELLLEASSLKIRPTLEMYNIYIKTLAKQMKLFKLTDNEKINNINKTWSIVQTILSKNQITINQNGGREDSSNTNTEVSKLLNSIILVYENAGYYDYAIEVLKCFPRFNSKPDHMTYFILLRMLGPKMKDPGRFFALWKEARTEIRPTKALLCMALDMAILSRSAKRTLEVLNEMYNSKVFPTHNLMKKLYESGKRITQIHLMINNLVTLQRKMTYEEKLTESKMLQTYIDEHELRSSLTPASRL